MASARSSTPISDQKKSTLQALEQQFAAAKAKAKKLQEEQLQRQKRNRDAATPRPQFDHPPGKRSTPSPASRSSADKGHVAPSPSDGESHHVYSKISVTLHENLSQADVLDANRKDVVHHIVYDIIQRGEEGGKFAKGAKSLKLDKMILLDNFVPKDPALMDVQARSLMRHAKRSRMHMSMKQHRKCGSFDLPEQFHHFDLYKPMHETWTEYIKELTKSNRKKQLSENLLMADLHGALMIVVDCKATSFKGVSGIMIRDTAETFGIISPDNRFRVVPKAGSVFVLQADCWKVTLCGDKLSPKEKLKETRAQKNLQPLQSR